MAHETPIRAPVGLPTFRPSLTLFLCLFAGQAAILVLSPILPDVAQDLGVSTAVAGQLRAVSGLVAAVAAVSAGPLARRMGLRDLLLVGLSVLALGSIASAAAPTFPVLAAAQVLIGVGLGIVLAGGVAAASEWAPDGGRARVLSWALLGPPAAWVVGMPVAGAVANLDWRYAWIAVPLLASLLALLAVRSRRSDEPSAAMGGWGRLWHNRDVLGWAVGEVLAYSAWVGTLVYAGALFAEEHGATPGIVGLLLAAGAVAYMPGNFLARRWVGDSSRSFLIGLALAAAVGVAMFGAVRPALWVSVVAFAGLGFVGGARTMLGSAFGLDAAPGLELVVTSVRAAALQLGYLIGAALGGFALGLGGYTGLGLALSALFLLASVPHVAAVARSGPCSD